MNGSSVNFGFGPKNSASLRVNAADSRFSKCKLCKVRGSDDVMVAGLLLRLLGIDLNARNPAKAASEASARPTGRPQAPRSPEGTAPRMPERMLGRNHKIAENTCNSKDSHKKC